MPEENLRRMRRLTRPTENTAESAKPTEGPPSKTSPLRPVSTAQAGAEKKKGLLESLFGFFSGDDADAGVRKPRGQQGDELDREVNELMEQLPEDAEEQTKDAAEGTPPPKGSTEGKGQKRGAHGKETKPANPPAKAAKGTVPVPPAAETPTPRTYRERRRLERQQQLAQGPTAATAETGSTPMTGTSDGQAAPLDWAAQRAARRLRQQPGTDPQSTTQNVSRRGPAAGAAEGVGTLDLDLEGLLGEGSGKKKKKKKGKVAEDELDFGEEEDGLPLGDEEGEDGLEGAEGAEGGNLEALDDETGKAEMLTKKCPHCKRQAHDTAFCPNCGAGMCDFCAPERVKLLDEVKWVCRHCKAEFKVKRKGASGSGAGLEEDEPL